MKIYQLKIIILISAIALSSNYSYAQINKCDNNNNYCNQPVKVKTTKSQMKSALNVIQVIPSPTNYTNDITFDGQYLWVGSAFDSLLYKVSPLDGTVIDSIKTIVSRPYGLTFDGQYIWVAANENNTLHKIDMTTGSSLNTYNLPVGYAGGLTFDGQYFWHNNSSTDKTYKIDTNGIITDSISTGLPLPSGLTFDGQYLWVADNSTHKIYKVDTLTGQIIDTIISPKQFPNGLAFDGQYLWLAENENSSGQDSLYKIDIGVTTTGIPQNLLIKSFNIYPNPTNGNFHISSNLTGDDILQMVRIYNSSGKLIFMTEPEVKNGALIEINLTNQLSGVYLCQLISNRSSIVKKIILK
nr:T9SS type A sorting domain-containing protein [uncultured Carboxylicivirga sp.]